MKSQNRAMIEFVTNDEDHILVESVRISGNKPPKDWTMSVHMDERAAKWDGKSGMCGNRIVLEYERKVDDNTRLILKPFDLIGRKGKKM